MSVASAVLAKFTTAAAGWTTIGTVGVGQTWIVKSASMFNASAAARDVRIYANDSPGSNIGVIFFQGINAGAVGYWNGWVVLGPGNNIQVYSDAAGVTFWISGSKLNGVA